MMKHQMSVWDKLAVKATQWLGTPASILAHTLLFLIALLAVPFVGLDRVMLILTTGLSLEAIYLALFIQMTVNRQHKRIKGIEEDIDDILEDTEELTEEETTD